MSTQSLLLLGLSLVVLGFGGWLVADRMFGRVISDEIFNVEHLAAAEFADRACTLTCSELKLFALTNYCTLLETEGDLLPSTNDVNYSLFLTYGRLFRLYNLLEKPSEAQRYFVSASNYFWTSRSRPIEETFLLTNSLFHIKL